MELNEHIHATKGECNAELTLAKKQPSKLRVHAIDIETNAQLPGVLVKVSPSSTV